MVAFLPPSGNEKPLGPWAKLGRLMSEGQKHMNLINCHAARMHLPKEIFMSLERLSLRELTVQILLNLELYRM